MTGNYTSITEQNKHVLTSLGTTHTKTHAITYHKTYQVSNSMDYIYPNHVLSINLRTSHIASINTFIL